MRIHGRGGQGNVVAAYLLAAAAIRAGFFAQAFPAFGAERRGAPVAAFVRVRKTPIQRRCEIKSPLFVIVQDATLLGISATLGGLGPDSRILANSGRSEGVRDFAVGDFQAVCLPATRIAEQALGKPIPNVPMLAALIALTGLLPLDSLHEVLTERFDSETAERNWTAADMAVRAVTAGAWQELADAHTD